MGTDFIKTFQQALGPWRLNQDRPLLQEPLLLAILFLAFALRSYAALTTAHIWDEERDWMLMAQIISFDPNNLNLPIRSFHHGALPAYFIKLGTLVFGESLFGFRIMGVLIGTATVAVVALAAQNWVGRIAAMWAAAIIAFNDFHAMVSTIGTDKVYSIFFAALACYFFTVALNNDKPRMLLRAAPATALSILCYEIMYILIPIFGIAVIFSERRSWFSSWHLYAAAALGLAVLLPDLLWNLSAIGQDEMSYGDHLKRLDGIGFTPHYLLFYLRDLVLPLYTAIGRHLNDPFSEYAVMNPLLGIMLLSAIGIWALRFILNRERRMDPVLLFLLVAFGLQFGFFTFSNPGYNGDLDNLGWPWVQFVLIPSAILAGALMQSLRGVKFHIVIFAVALSAVAIDAFQIASSRFLIPSYNSTLAALDHKGQGNTEYAVEFYACALCDPSPKVELVSVSVGGDTLTRSKASTDIEAELGAADVKFVLRDLAQPYLLTYRLTERSGATHTVVVNSSDADGTTAPYWCEKCTASH